MPLTFKVDQAKNLTIFTASGDVTYDELINALESYIVSDPTTKQIFNFSNSTALTLNFEKFRQLAERAKTRIPNGEWQTAIIVSGEVGYGKASIYRGLSDIEDIPQDVRIFSNINEAYEWLGTPQEE